jgi:4-amino-4-deoxy-L-arabinose transferase-like glycosyltransferase
VEVRGVEPHRLEIAVAVASVATDVAARDRAASLANQLGWLIVGILFFVFVLFPGVRDGMFFDGLTYASVARNMAEGVGTIWEPRFSDTVFPLFAEHPPLQFWMQSAALKLFGDSVHVEKFFAAAVGLASGALVVLIWKRLTRQDRDAARLAWLPLLFLLAIPNASNVIADNMLENTLGMFALLAVYGTARANDPEQSRKPVRRLGFLVASGLATAAAVLTKGPVGLFPLAAVGLQWLAMRQPGFLRAVLGTIIVMLTVVVVLGLLLLWPEARGYAQRYADAQLYASLSGARGSAGGGLSAVRSLAGAVVIPLALCLAAVGLGSSATRRFGSAAQSGPATNSWHRSAFFMLLVGISASLPILVSPRVFGFYFVPSLPYYAIGFALLCAPAVGKLQRIVPERLWSRARVTGWLAILACVVVLPFSAGGVGRDATLIHDVRLIGDHVCGNEQHCRPTLSICPEIQAHSALYGYFQRYYQISLAPDDTASPFRIGHPDCAAPDPAIYEAVDLRLQTYRLYARRPAP